MFIRWNRSKNKKGNFLYAVLVEAKRIDGKPRQKTVKYLGGIGENKLTAFRRLRFWENTEKNLSAINLSPEVREKIIVALRKRVAKPSKDEIEAEREKGIKRLKELTEIISKGRA